MFKQLLKTDYFQLITNVANKNVIKEDRQKFHPVFDAARDALYDDPKIIMSDCQIISGKKYDKNSDLEEYMYIFTIYTRRTATKIANEIHKKIGKFVQMREIIPLEEYEIMYDMRGLIKIYRIDKYKNVNLPILFNAVKINNLYYFPPEIELMDIYHKLYRPNYYKEWEILLPQEDILYDKVITTIGGAICKDCKTQKKIDINNVKLLILKFLDNENYVMIGKWSHNLIKSNKDITDDHNIQIISENDIEHDYQNIVNFLSTYTKYGIYYKKKKLYIPKDNRIYKYTLFIKFPIIGKDSRSIDNQFLDIYNCAEYELVPFVEKKYNNLTLKVGNLFVQMRFLLIDMWLIKLLKYLKIVGTTQFTSSYSYIHTTMKLMKKLLPISFKDKYTGINYDEKVEQKIIISEKQIKKTSYYPEFSMKKDKKYKIIATSS